MHSARWDWSYDLRGKRVAVVGNGATAVQIAPEVAKEASHLTVYQRTPNWIIPRSDKPVAAWQKALMTYVPPVRWAKRAFMMDFREYLHAAIADGESDLSQKLRKMGTDTIKAQLPDRPDLWEKLTPDYSPGCKRILITDDYYPTLAQEHVDLETRRISRITESGIEVEDGDSQNYDLIVLATGFRAVEFMYPIQVYGANGRSLADIWDGGARAYLGVTVEDLPNFAMLYGPNTNLGHNSVILMIESQSRYLNGLIGEVLRARQGGQSLAVRPRPEAVEAYNEQIQSQLRTSSFADPKCNSWYKRADGRITNNWPDTVFKYQSDLAQVRWRDYLAEGTGSDTRRTSSCATTRVGQAREGHLVGGLSTAGAAALGALGLVMAAGRYYRMAFN